MKRTVDAILRDYGSLVKICTGEKTVVVRAFLHPVTSKSWQNMQHVKAGLGTIPQGQYLYLGPPDAGIAQADYLEVNGKRYLPRREDVLLQGDTPLYLWGLCVPYGRDDVWNS